jgi:molybdopterin synthase sulfur carrier subunit
LAVTVRVPVSLQKLTRDQSRVEVEAASVRDVVDTLERQFPGIRASLVDEAGNLRRFVNVFVNDSDIRSLQGQDTSVKDGDEIYIVPAIAGGSSSWA